MQFEYALVRAEKEILRVRSAYAPDEIGSIGIYPIIVNDAGVAVSRLLGALGEKYSLQFLRQYTDRSLGFGG